MTYHVRGEKHGNHKLLECEARAVFELAHNTNLSLRTIGSIFGVAKATVMDVKAKRNWGWLNNQEEASDALPD